LSLPEIQKQLTHSGESADSGSNERCLPIDLVRVVGLFQSGRIAGRNPGPSTSAQCTIIVVAIIVGAKS